MARVALAVGIVGLMLIPVSMWRHPSIDATYHGFDWNLMAISTPGTSASTGKVDMTPGALKLTAVSGSHPTVHLVTTPLSFTAVFDAELVALPKSGVPLRIGVWNPAARTGYFVLFDHDHGDVIRQQVIIEGDARQDLLGGFVQLDSILGPFATGQPYRVTMDLDQAKRELAVQVTGASLATNTVITPQQAPDLFKAFRPTLTVSAFPDQGTSEATISNFVLTVPSQPSLAAEETVRIDDARATTLTTIALIGASGLCLLAAAAWFATQIRTSPRSLRRLLRLSPSRRAKLPLLLVLASAAGAYVLANSLLFGVASPHFEIVSSKVWSYVAVTNGITDLYYRTLLVPAADAWGGNPVHEATFSYGFTKAYYYLAAAWAFRPFSSPGTFTVNTFSFEVLLKSLNVLFGLLDAGFVYLIVRRLINPSSAWVPALFFILNPALILVMSLWGSTETISLFFILGSIWLAEKQHALGAWLMLTGGAFTRPQMMVFAFLLGAVYLRKFGAGRNLFAISWTVLISFVVIAPFALAISPSVPIDYVTRTLAFHLGNQQADVAYLGLSPANYSVWTLPLLLSGEHGLARMWSPATMPFIGSLSYGQVGGALSVGLLLVVGAVLLFRSNLSAQPGGYLPLVCFAMLGWMLLTPGAMSRYMVYPIAALILCRAAFSMGAYSLAIGTLTGVACITIFGHLSNDFLGYSGSVNVLSPTNNAISRFLFGVFEADWFISLAATANIAVLIALGIGAWDSLKGEIAPHSISAAASAT